MLALSAGGHGFEELPPGASHTARLLVGTWREVSHNGMPTPPASDLVWEFAPNGTWTAHVTYPAVGEWTVHGTYAIAGDFLLIRRVLEEDVGRVWVHQIVSINNAEFVISSPPGSDTQRDVVHVRVLRA
jgi:hypothetical protein